MSWPRRLNSGILLLADIMLFNGRYLSFVADELNEDTGFMGQLLDLYKH